MEELAMGRQPGQFAVSAGCAYIIGDGELGETCGEPQRPGSAYCMRHHALCHVRSGSRAELARLREVETLASAVGGRQGRAAGGPPERFLRRLEHAVRGFAWPNRSWYVRNG